MRAAVVRSVGTINGKQTAMASKMSDMIAALEDRLKERALALGFALVGIAPATAADGLDRLREWLARGYAGTMDYLHRHEAARHHPASILSDVRSVIMVAMSYAPEPPRASAPGSPRIALYARGDDYHDVLWRRLERLLDWLQGEQPGCRGRAVADTAPLMERDFARRAGLGWIGKNTLLLNRPLGSFLVLGALLVNVDLRPDAPWQTDHCGSCTACLDACPTDAFVAPGVLDARRCISYLTIENKETIPLELRPGVGDWLFGCDVCQDVCPWNHKAPAGTEPRLQPRPELERLDAVELLSLSEQQFRQRFADTALTRAKRRGLLRNAAVVLGNIGDRAALPALRVARDDADDVVREAAAWAIAQIEVRCPLGTPAGRDAADYCARPEYRPGHDHA